MQKTLNPVTHICSFLSARGLAMLLRPPALVSHLKVGMTSCVTRLSVCSDGSTMMTDMNPGAYIPAWQRGYKSLCGEDKATHWWDHAAFLLMRLHCEGRGCTQ